jgi:hypothetical protein
VYLAGTGVSKKFLKYLSPQILGETKLFSSQISQAKTQNSPKFRFDGTEYGKVFKLLNFPIHQILRFRTKSKSLVATMFFFGTTMENVSRKFY